MSDEWTTEWETRCRGCGSCCFEKYENESGTIFYTQTACRYLDIITRQCRIYENRFSINPECIKLTPKLVETLSWLPTDCGYRKSNITEINLPKKTSTRRKRKKR